MCAFYELPSSHAREITVKPEIPSSDYRDVSREISRSSYSQLRSPELRCAPVNAIRSLRHSRINLNFRPANHYTYIYIYRKYPIGENFRVDVSSCDHISIIRFSKPNPRTVNRRHKGTLGKNALGLSMERIHAERFHLNVRSDAACERSREIFESP